MLTTSNVLADFEVSFLLSILNNLENVKVQTGEQDCIASIADEARKRGIIIIKNYLIDAPESKFKYIEMYLEANLYPFCYNHYKKRMRLNEKKFSQFLEARLKGTKRAYE